MSNFGQGWSNARLANDVPNFASWAKQLETDFMGWCAAFVGMPTCYLQQHSLLVLQSLKPDDAIA